MVCLVFACSGKCQHVCAERVESPLSLEYGKRLWQDAWHIVGAPLRWDGQNWLWAGGAILGVGAVSLADTSIRNLAQRHRSGTSNAIAEFFNPFGLKAKYAVMGGFYLTGLIVRDERAKAVALDALAARLIASGIVTSTFMGVVGRSRPWEDGRPYVFRPFGGSTSFPSGHVTAAFAFASTIAAHYDQLWVKVLTYGVATGVGLARINDNAHFASDVAAGALIGTLVGNAVVRFNRAQRGRLRFVPLLDDRKSGLAIAAEF